MIEQGSPEWLAQRLGRVTASRIADVCARTKSGWGASRANYMAQLIAERLTGVPAENFTSTAMQWGLDTEAEARAAYEFMTDTEVMPAGFIDHPSIIMSGASPDGLIGDDGLLELKCPNTATHLDSLLGQSVALKYEQQMLWQLACSGRAWCDFVSYDPRLPEPMRLFVRRVRRDPTKIEALERIVIDFLDELYRKLEDLNALAKGHGFGLSQAISASVIRDKAGRPMSALEAG